MELDSKILPFSVFKIIFEHGKGFLISRQREIILAPLFGNFRDFRIDNVRLKKYSFSGGTKGVIIYTKGRNCRIDSASRLHGS